MILIGEASCTNLRSFQRLLRVDNPVLLRYSASVFRGNNHGVMLPERVGKILHASSALIAPEV